MGMSNEGPYLLPRGCGSETDQMRATCLDLFTMTDEDLLREQGRLEAFILSDDPVLGSTIPDTLPDDLVAEFDSEFAAR